eukprot:754261-Hanusia_phi.AAC.4
MQRELKAVKETVATRTGDALDVHPLREELERMKKELDERNEEIARLRDLKKDREDTLNAYTKVRERGSRKEVEQEQPSPSTSDVTSVGGVLKSIPKSPTARKAMGVSANYSPKMSLIPVPDSSSQAHRPKFSSSATAEILQFHQAQGDARERAKSAPRMRPNQQVLALEWEDSRRGPEDQQPARWRGCGSSKGEAAEQFDERREGAVDKKNQREAEETCGTGVQDQVDVHAETSELSPRLPAILLSTCSNHLLTFVFSRECVEKSDLQALLEHYESRKQATDVDASREFNGLDLAVVPQAERRRLVVDTTMRLNAETGALVVVRRAKAALLLDVPAVR